MRFGDSVAQETARLMVAVSLFVFVSVAVCAGVGLWKLRQYGNQVRTAAKIRALKLAFENVEGADRHGAAAICSWLEIPDCFEDGWGRQIQVRRTRRCLRITSFGRDGKPGRLVQGPLVLRDFDDDLRMECGQWRYSAPLRE